MFKNIISSTAFTSEKAQMYFIDKITTGTDGFDGDRTFISSLRAFLWNKMPENETLRFLYFNTRSDEYETRLMSILDSASSEKKFYVVNLYDIPKFSDSFKSSMKDKAVTYSMEYNLTINYNAKVEALFVKEFDVICFSCLETRSVVFFVPNLTLQKWHLLQCSILGVLPWYYNPKTDELDDDDRDLMYSLKKGNDDEYLRVINKIASKIDFKTAYIRKALEGFEHIHEKEQYDRVQSEIREYESAIEEAQEKISNFISAIEQRNTILFGLSYKMSQNNGDSEIMKYFINNQSLDLLSVTNTRIKYICKGYLTYFDSSEAEKYIDNEKSRFYISDSYGSSTYRNAPAFEDARMLYKAIFIDRILKIRMCAAYEINTGNARVNGLSGFPYGGEYDCYMANPHIDYHACIGTFGQIFTECLMKNDYIGCIENTIASALSLNLSDFTVLGEFISLLWSPKSTDRSTTNSTKCIELPNGVCVHAKDAIAWLKEESTRKESKDE